MNNDIFRRLDTWITIFMVIIGMALVARRAWLAWQGWRKIARLTRNPVQEGEQDRKVGAQDSRKIAQHIPQGAQDRMAGAQPLAKWWPILAREACHVLIVGPTKAGKSTAAGALLHSRATILQEHVMVIDPHGAPGDWGGAPIIGMGRNYADIDKALRAILRELTDRYQQRATIPGAYFQRLTIFVDEVPAISQNCKHWREFFAVVSSEGRKVSISLVALTQSRLVDLLGIKGQSDIRENFHELLLGAAAITADKSAGGMARPAAYDTGHAITLVETEGLAGIAIQVNPAAIWQGETPMQEVERMIESAIKADLSPPLPLDAPAPVWSIDHIRVAAWLTADPEISVREVARRLFDGKDGGSRNVKASRLMGDVKMVLDSGTGTLVQPGLMQRTTAESTDPAG